MWSVFNNEVLESFSQINKEIFKLAKEDAENIGLTVVQLKALYQISTKPKIGLSELAENLKLTNSTVSGVIDRLVNSGYVERDNPKHDRRAITLHLTNEGKLKIKQFIESDSKLVKYLNKINQLPEEDIKQLLQIHKEILNILTF
ncbi:MarR family winged helix-turn-helix transcriptional regulator [Heyndrickxia sp. NPDC080065]|uniref:MarR family winged helix-turn-helix transcriptional regulator n=1 Tax=Heyndrickxia sp. NPDC080065 TaxID=3390568 RepID=UPI003CFEC2E1